MLGKLREITESRDKIVEMHSEFSTLRDDITELSANISGMRAEIESIRQDVKNMRQELKTEAELYSSAMAEHRSALTEEVGQLKLLSSALQNKVIEKLNVEIFALSSTLKERAKNYVDVETELKGILASVQDLKTEIQKFSEIGRSIKKEDFQMPNYQRIMRAAEAEKAEMQKKIDTLERLISAERRRQISR